MSDPFKAWEFESDAQKNEMMEDVTIDNCGKKLKFIRDISGLSRRDLADVFDVSESTIKRLELGSTKPTKEFMLMLAGLCVIGKAKYSKMSTKEKETLSEFLGATGGVTTGVGAAIGAVSVSGTISGLSAAGITSGLAAIGGGTMLGGMAVIATIPVAVGAAGYGLVKGIKLICKANRLNCKEVDSRYEITPSKHLDDEGFTGEI